MRWITLSLMGGLVNLTILATLCELLVRPPTLLAIAPYAYSLIFSIVVFLWYRIDTERRDYLRTTLSSSAIIFVPLLALPYYLIRSRGAWRGAIAVVGCVIWLCFAASAAIATRLIAQESGLLVQMKIDNPSTPASLGEVSYKTVSQPNYPFELVRRHIEGTVVLKVLIGKTGFAESVSVEKSSGEPLLDQSATEAVQKSEFNPAIENGAPVSRYALIPFEFKLTH